MQYQKSDFEDAVERFGEVFFVLDSDREYIVHGTEGYDLEPRGDTHIVRVKGMKDGEYIVTEFPLDAIEHHYSHKEL